MKGKSNQVINLPLLFPPTEEEEEEDETDRFLEEYLAKILTITLNPVANSNDLICVVIFGEFWI